MGRYLVLWEVDQTRIPIDPKERGDAWAVFMAMVRKDMEKGLTKERGSFVGETSGFSINEGTELEVMNALQQYVPYVFYEVHPLASVSQVEEMIKALSG